LSSAVPILASGAWKNHEQGENSSVVQHVPGQSRKPKTAGLRHFGIIGREIGNRYSVI
jgi:hypothetical protein